MVSTLAVVAAVTSRFDALSALASSAKAGFAMKANLQEQLHMRMQSDVFGLRSSKSRMYFHTFSSIS